MYASTAEVLSLTAQSVTEDEIYMAQALIELMTNRTEAASGAEDISVRDLYWLKLATAYQAAHMKANPGTFTAGDLKAISQGDLSLTFRDSAEAQLIAPLARKALSRTSWTRNRSVHVGSSLIWDEDISGDETTYDGEWDQL